MVVILISGVILLFMSESVTVVKSHEKKVLTVRGNYKKVLNSGFSIIPPFVSDTTSFKIRQTIDIASQDSITSDNTTVRMYNYEGEIKITNPEKCFKETEDVNYEVSNVIQESLRRAVGNMESKDVDSEIIAREALSDAQRSLKGTGIRLESVHSQDARVEFGDNVGESSL